MAMKNSELGYPHETTKLLRNSLDVAKDSIEIGNRINEELGYQNDRLDDAIYHVRS